MKLIEIIEFVNKEFSIDITGRKRTTDYVEARALYYKLAKENTKLSLERIGQKVNRGHATVLHGIKNVWPHAIKFNENIQDSYYKFKDIAERNRAIEEQRDNITGDLEHELFLAKNELYELKKIGIDQYEGLKKELEFIKSNSGRFLELVSRVADDERKLDDLYLRMSAAVRMIKSAQYN